jgi:autotransporter-associated beta strand protein
MYPLFTKASCTALHRHFTPASSDSYPRLARNTILQTILAVAISLLTPMIAHAGSATWGLNPGSGDWNTAANWTPTTVPNGPTDIATFALSNTTDVSISADTEVNGITFNSAATNPYFIPVNDGITLTLSGTGITNNSGITQNFMTRFSVEDPGAIVFSNSATAGSAAIDNNGYVLFSNTSTAGSANIQNGGTGVINFSDTSTAGNAFIFNGNAVVFSDSSTAGNALIIGDEFTIFLNSSTAGSATIADIGGGEISFGESSKGGTARIEVFRFGGGSGFLFISQHNSPGVTIGSIEGDGFAFLGANNLTVGSNNLSTIFSGVIEDEGFSGSLTKIGTGTLDLMGENTYTGLTNINGGVLQIDGSTSSNTFINNKGTLAGGGTVNGNVTNYNGTVSPGDPLGVPGALTVTSNYMQTPSATLVIQITGGEPGQVSVLNVVGNANLNGALDPVFVNGFVPAIGQSFTFLNYASLTGSFSHIQNPVFDHGTKRWSLVYGPNSAYLVVVSNGRGQLSEVLGNYRR